MAETWLMKLFSLGVQIEVILWIKNWLKFTFNRSILWTAKQQQTDNSIVVDSKKHLLLKQCYDKRWKITTQTKRNYLKIILLLILWRLKVFLCWNIDIRFRLFYKFDFLSYYFFSVINRSYESKNNKQLNISCSVKHTKRE